jgi:hypothetical protein
MMVEDDRDVAVLIWTFDELRKDRPEAMTDLCGRVHSASAR